MHVVLDFKTNRGKGACCLRVGPCRMPVGRVACLRVAANRGKFVIRMNSWYDSGVFGRINIRIGRMACWIFLEGKKI